MQAGDHEARVSEPHTSTIEALAQQTGASPERVKTLFERELAELEATAKVQGFLSVLAFRNVKLMLREPHADAT
jgi:hypothetical protein